MDGPERAPGRLLTRRHLRAREDDAAAGAPGAVVLRPPRWPIAGMVLVLAALPRRGGDPGVLLALAHGARSGPALALYAWWALLACGSALALARATTLRARADGSPELVVRGPFRRRAYDLRRVRRVVPVRTDLGSGASRRRALLLDAHGHVVAAPRTHRDLWARPDAEALLEAAGITVDGELRRTTPRALERAYPGSTSWVDRTSGWSVLAGALALFAVAFALLVLVEG